jgi:hypothetical protein
MKAAFRRLCLISFCIVLAALPLGLFEDYFLRHHDGWLFGCTPTAIVGLECGYGVVNTAKELVLNIPVGLAWGPIVLFSMIVYRGVTLDHLSFPGFIVICVFVAIDFLAAAHISIMIVRLTRRRAS